MYGGPMYALERGLNMKWLAILFAVFTALASFGIGCTVQANSIALLAHETFGVPTWTVGIFVCVLTGVVILGGVKSIARVCTVLVPFMALFYVLGCIVILCMNAEFVWPALQLIVNSAFNPSAAGGGFVGATVMMAARYGIARGLFSNESGMGSAPIVAAAAQTRNPVRQALVSSTGTFWDTVVICALTGMVLVSSILAYPDITYADGAALTKVAFSKIPYVGAPLLTFGILTFAFSTILGWSYYGESAVNYIEGRRINRFRRPVLWLHHQPRHHLEHCRLHECPHDNPQPCGPAAAQWRRCPRDPQISVVQSFGRGDERGKWKVERGKRIEIIREIRVIRGF